MQIQCLQKFLKFVKQIKSSFMYFASFWKVNTNIFNDDDLNFQNYKCYKKETDRFRNSVRNREIRHRKRI